MLLLSRRSGSKFFIRPTTPQRYIAQFYRVKTKAPLWTQAFDNQLSVPVLKKHGFSNLDLKTPQTVKHSASQRAPSLFHGLDVVLREPGLHEVLPNVQAGVFSPFLQRIHQPFEINYDAFPPFIAPSKDFVLASLAKEHGCNFVASTSSVGAALSQIYYLFSKHKTNNISSLPSFSAKPTTAFSPATSCAFILRPTNGVWAVDKPTEASGSQNILLDLGRSMERMFTMSQLEFERLAINGTALPQPNTQREAYNYLKVGNILLRSQIDCQDSLARKTFDLKTRANFPIRTHIESYWDWIKPLRSLNGLSDSYEREYYDMIRAAFLKYIFQARIGQMDGVLMAYHNTQTIFGFEYLTRETMEACIFDTQEMADASFQICTSTYNFLLNQILQACDKPGHCLKVALKTNPPQALAVGSSSLTQKLDIFVEVVPDEGWGAKSANTFPRTQNQVRQFSLKLATQVDGYTTHGPLLLAQDEELSVMYLFEEAITSQRDIKESYWNLLYWCEE